MSKHDEAEAITDRLCASGLVDALSADKYGSFERGVQTLRAATP
jgi:hypothetical protein